MIKQKILQPKALINIKPIERLKYMAMADGGLGFGSLTRIKEIEQAEMVRAKLPTLAYAASQVGSPHVRNMASIAGNLCQQTRCWYFRRNPDTGSVFHCHRKGNEGVCFGRDGENQYHSIMAEGPCVSSFPSDLGVVLSALDAKLKITGPDGDRSIPLDRFYTESGPALEGDELITSIFVPERGIERRSNFIKFRTRQTIDFAIVSVAVSFESNGGLVKNPRIFVGGVSPKPFRAEKAEKSLDGSPLTPAAAKKAGEIAIEGCKPLAYNGYKASLMKTLVRRALLEC